MFLYLFKSNEQVNLMWCNLMKLEEELPKVVKITKKNKELFSSIVDQKTNLC